MESEPESEHGGRRSPRNADSCKDPRRGHSIYGPPVATVLSGESRIGICERWLTPDLGRLPIATQRFCREPVRSCLAAASVASSGVNLIKGDDDLERDQHNDD